VVRLSVDGDLAPADALHTGHGPDGDTLLLEHGTLLDVQFDERAGRGGGARGGTRVADAQELVADPRPVDADGAEHLLDAEPADERERTHHVGGEPGALLVGEERHCERARRCPAALLDGLDDLEAREHAEVAVVLPAGSHGVDVRSGHDRGACPGVPGADDVADRIHRDVEAQVPHPGDHQVATVAIGVGERKARTTSALGRSHLGEAHDAVHQPGTVDPQVGGAVCHGHGESVRNVKAKSLSCLGLRGGHPRRVPGANLGLVRFS
jgi:hypothetical protein